MNIYTKEKILVDIEKYKEDLVNMKLEDVYTRYVLGGEVWYFKEKFGEQWFDKYNEFKIFISKKLGVHYNDIAIAGSAKTGFSLNPSKGYRAFGENSDIDIIIISQPLFYRFWNAYLKDSYSEVRVNKYLYVCQCIFRKFITFDGFKKGNEEFSDWEKQTRGFEKDLQLCYGIAHDIHYRIYESWEAAQMYYISGMKKSLLELEDRADENN